MKEELSSVDLKIVALLSEHLDQHISNPNLILSQNMRESLVEFMEADMWVPREEIFNLIIKPLEGGISFAKFCQLLPHFNTIQVCNGKVRHITFAQNSLIIEGFGKTTYAVMKQVIESSYPYADQVNNSFLAHSF
jgi:hypothetical protein